MGDQVLLVVAEEGDELVAGALNLIGGDTLFGRLWGCQPETYYQCLHFEACYYQVQASHYFFPHLLLDNYFHFSRFWFYGWSIMLVFFIRYLFHHIIYGIDFSFWPPSGCQPI